MSDAYWCHPSSDVASIQIGDNTRIWQYAVVLAGAKIGSSCNICSHCLIESNVELGDNVTVKSGVQLWDGTKVESNVFIGPNVSFANDIFPRSKRQRISLPKTVLKKGCSIGSGATILPGVTIGQDAMVGAGSVVTTSVPPGTVVVGNPARIVRYVDSGKETRESGQDQVSVSLSSIPGVKYIQIVNASDLRGELTAIELSTDELPFKVNRIFFVHHVPSFRVRGEHAHKKCHQILIALSGSLRVGMDNGQLRHEVVLDDPSQGLYVPAGIWTTQFQFSDDAVLCVIASEAYDTFDYIRDYDEYIESIRKT